MWQIGKRLRERREAADLTQGQVAEYEEIVSSYVSQLESGKNQPNWDLLARLVKRYRTNADYILGLIDDPSPSPRIKLSRQERDMVKMMEMLSEEARNTLLEIAGVIQKRDKESILLEMQHLDSLISETFDEQIAAKLRERIRAGRQANLLGGISDAFGSSVQ